MRLKQPSDNGPLAQHNGNENSLELNQQEFNNSLTTITNNTGVTENEVYNNGTTDSARRRQDTLQWCNTVNTIQHQQRETIKLVTSDSTTNNYLQTPLQLQKRPLYNINNNNLAASLRTGTPPATQNNRHHPRGTTASSVCSESSPDDSLLEYEEAHQSCSSISTSPQDEDRGFDLSDSESLSDDGNISGADTHIRQSRGIVNPNYPGFQHLAHTLDYTIKVCSDTDFTDDDLDLDSDTTKLNTSELTNINNNNNNNEDDIEFKIDSVNRLDSVENIQKVFYDKPKLNIPLEFDGEKQTNCLDSASGGSVEDLEGNFSAAPRTEAVEVKLNIPGDFVDDLGKDEILDKLNIPGTNYLDDFGKVIQKLEDKLNIGKEIQTNVDEVVLNIPATVSSVDIVGDFGKELESSFESELDEIKLNLAENVSSINFSNSESEFEEIKLNSASFDKPVRCDLEPNAQFELNETGVDFSTCTELNFEEVKLNITGSVSTVDIVGDFGAEIEKEIGRIVGRGIEQELEEAVEKLSVASDLSPSALKYNIEPNADEPFEKFRPVLHQAEPVAKSGQQLPIESVVLKQEFPVASQPVHVKLAEEYEVFKSELIEKMVDIKVARVTSTEALTLKMNQPYTQIANIVHLKETLKPKMADAFLSEARECLNEPIEKQLISESEEKLEKMITETKKPEKQRRDSNREAEDMKGKMDVEDLEKFCKEDKTKDDVEKDEDSAVPRKKEKMEINYVKKRRDSSQAIPSLITIPRRELGSRVRDNLNRRSLPAAREKKRTSPDMLGSFDVYNIETAMPVIDLDAIESHLKAAREEERRRRTDREEIRRRLAMGSEDDYYNGCDRPGRKPSLQARLQSGMNLQICFMNETASDTESPSSDTECSVAEPKQHNSLPIKSLHSINMTQTHPKLINQQPRPVSLPLGITQPLLQPVTQPMTEADFFARQARLQTEARMALAQAKEMAHMQMEVERQRQKKSPITEMVRSSLEKVGIPFPEERRRVSRQILTEMNVAQLQVIVNDLHTQIETLNENLVRFLMNRDDLHMEQDSMLVDIEDLTRYLGAKEQTVNDQKLSSVNNNIPPPSPAPASPLSAINNSMKPRLHRIASLVKK